MYGSEWNPSIRPNPSRDPRLITNYDSLGIRPLKLVAGSEKGNNQPQSMSHHIPISNPIYLLPLLILRPAHLLYVIHLLKIIKHSVWSHFKLLIRINTSPNTSPSSSCLYIVICVHNLIVPVLPVQYPLLNHLLIDWAIFNSSVQLSARDPSSNPTFSQYRLFWLLIYFSSNLLHNSWSSKFPAYLFFWEPESVLQGARPGRTNSQATGALVTYGEETEIKFPTVV